MPINTKPLIDIDENEELICCFCGKHLKERYIYCSLECESKSEDEMKYVKSYYGEK